MHTRNGPGDDNADPRNERGARLIQNGPSANSQISDTAQRILRQKWTDEWCTQAGRESSLRTDDGKGERQNAFYLL